MSLGAVGGIKRLTQTVFGQKNPQAVKKEFSRKNYPMTYAFLDEYDGFENTVRLVAAGFKVGEIDEKFSEAAATHIKWYVKEKGDKGVLENVEDPETFVLLDDALIADLLETHVRKQIDGFSGDKKEKLERQLDETRRKAAHVKSRPVTEAILEIYDDYEDFVDEIKKRDPYVRDSGLAFDLARKIEKDIYWMDNTAKQQVAYEALTKNLFKAGFVFSEDLGATFDGKWNYHFTCNFSSVDIEDVNNDGKIEEGVDNIFVTARRAQSRLKPHGEEFRLYQQLFSQRIGTVNKEALLYLDKAEKALDKVGWRFGRPSFCAVESDGTRVNIAKYKEAGDEWVKYSILDVSADGTTDSLMVAGIGEMTRSRVAYKFGLEGHIYGAKTDESGEVQPTVEICEVNLTENTPLVLSVREYLKRFDPPSSDSEEKPE